ncbi:MAG TPA: hypothetical protein VE030_11055 [Burkholderiales bacterium]|nr:hypothetical protein [Burkholderiales bacterium]
MKALTPETAAAVVGKLALMAFFPSDPEVRAGLVAIFIEMVETDEQMEWLGSRAMRMFARWPGVAEIRALYCSRYKPRDGLESYSEIYPEGFPTERKEPEPGRAARRGEPVTADPVLDRKIRTVAASKKLKPVRKGR